MSDSDFERQGMAVLASIESQLEALMQTTSVQWDSALEGTVLRLTFDDDSRIVINLQAPLREIWLASRRGGFHFRRDPAGGWLDTRDACPLGERVAQEVAHHAAIPVEPLTFA
nr:iron donor protein CyaY [Betaproteobacteria bacterium]